MTQDRKARVVERPLTARSVVASVLLGMRRPELSGQRLVRTAELFGLAEGTTRVALSRMVVAGELTMAGGRYRLAGRLLDRQARQEASRHPTTRRWDGTWRLAVVAGGSVSRSAGERVELRRNLARLGLAEWREGVWARPDNLRPDTVRPDDLGSDLPELAGCTWLTASLASVAAGVELAASLWDLDGWAARASELRQAMAVTAGDLEAGDTKALAPCFVTAAAVVRHLAADPLLPAPLRPAGWPGAALRDDYDRYETTYQGLLGSWLAGLAR